jgi:hypothetical protein
VEPHRRYPDDDQTWYGGEWDAGRHGAPAAPEQRPSADPPAWATTSGSFSTLPPGDVYGDPPGGRRGPRSGEPLPPLPGDSGPTTDPGDSTSRRSVESIDVGALRRQQPGGEFRAFGDPEPPAPAARDYPGDFGASDHAPGGNVSAAPTGPVLAPPSLAAYGPAPGTTYGSPPPSALNAPTSQVNVVGGHNVYQTKKTGLQLGIAVLVVLFEIPALLVLFSSIMNDTMIITGTIAGVFLVAGLPPFGAGVYGLLSGAASGVGGLRLWSRTPLVYLPVGIVLFLCAALAAG